MKKYIIIAFILLGSITTAYAQKSHGSIAYVDLQYILHNLPQYESANDQLTLISKRWQKEIDALQEEVRILTTNYQTEQIFLSEALRKQREEEIIAKENEVLELKRKYFGPDGELYKKREALMKPIQDDIYNAIQELADENRYDIVKDRSADPSLLYMSNKLDISDQILRKLGAK